MDIDNGEHEELGYYMIMRRDLFSLDMVIDSKFSVICWGDNDMSIKGTEKAKNDWKERNVIF